MPVDSAQLDNLFAAALARSEPFDRTAYLDQACVTNPELRERLDALLAAHDAAGSFLQLPDEEATTPFVTLSERPGTTIGRYKLLEQIGEGGFGVVFMAEQEHPVRRRVALKVIKLGMDTKQVVARFEAERQALAMMDHPNIAKVFDAGATEAGRPYFVMELVRGMPITEYCDESRLTTDQRLMLFQTVCAAVQHAHQKGIIHRDLKPSNVLVTLHDNEAVPKVIDFGVAKATQSKLTERTLFTEFRQMIGTPSYMSPEQAQMSGLDVDTRSDVYSLGVLLYELLTGTTPIDARQLTSATYDDLRRLICEVEPPTPSTRLTTLTSEQITSLANRRHCEPTQLASNLRSDLDWIAMKCLEKNRTRRYDSASALAQDLQHYLDGQPVEARPPSHVYRMQKYIRRNRSAVLIAAASVASLLAAIAGLAISNTLVTSERDAKAQALREREVALTEAKQQQLAADQNADRARKSETLARQRLYVAQMNLAMQAWQSGESPRSLGLLEGQRPGSNDEDMRGFEWYYLWRLCHLGSQTLTGHTNAVMSVKYSPDGRTLASASWDGTVRLWDVSTGAAKKVFSESGQRSLWEVAYSPDGTMIAAAGKEGSSDTFCWNVSSGELLYRISVSLEGLGFSPDGQTLFGSQFDLKNVEAPVPCSWFAKTGEKSPLFDQINFKGLTFGMSPDSKSLGLILGPEGGNNEVEFHDLQTGKLVRRIPQTGMMALGISPDGKSLATASAEWDKAPVIYDLKSGEALFRLEGQSAIKRALRFSPDGRRLAVGDIDGGVFVWDLYVKKVVRKTALHDGVWALDFSPDGQTLAIGSLDGTITLWNMTPVEEATSTYAPNDVGDLRFTPDSRSIIAIGRKSAAILDAKTGETRKLLPWQNAKAISHDGRQIFGPDGDNSAIWDVASEKIVKRLPLSLDSGQRPELRAIFSTDGTKIAVFQPWQGGTGVTLCEVATGKSRRLPEPPKVNIISAVSAAFSPNGRYLAAGYQFYHVLVWDLETGEVTRVLRLDGAMAFAESVRFAPDGAALVICSSRGDIAFWDVENGKLLKSFRSGASGIKSIDFSSDGKTFVTGSNDMIVRLWDIASQQEKLALKGHKLELCTVRFSPDGNTLATQSIDSFLKLWKASANSGALAMKSADTFDISELQRSFWLPQMLRLAAISHANLGDFAKARDCLSESITACAPGDWQNLNQAAWVLAASDVRELRDGKRAVEVATRAAELSKFKDAGTLDTLARAYVELGDFDSAVKWEEKAVELDPSQPRFRIRLNAYRDNEAGQAVEAWAWATSADPKKRDGKRALELAQKLAQFSEYKDAAILGALAAAHAENLEFEQAVSWEEKALAIAQPEQQPTYQTRLESYRNKKRWWVKE